MSATQVDPTRADPARRRWVGLDLARAIALLGMAATHVLVMYPSGMARREGKPPLRSNAARLHYVLARFCSSVSFVPSRTQMEQRTWK